MQAQHLTSILIYILTLTSGQMLGSRDGINFRQAALISRAKFVHTFRNVFGSPKTFRILANFFYFVRSFCFCYYPSNYELNVVTFSSSFRHFVLLCFRDLPVNRYNFNFLLLILTHCTQFQLFALNFNFQRCFGIYLRFLSQ